MYNGNISHLVTAIQGFEIQGTAYQYDQLQRLKGMRVFRPAGLAASNSWAGSAETNEYKNSYSYDENGNILSLVRNGTASGLLMDNFAYKYIGLDNLPVALSNRKSNRLDFVNDTGADDAANDGDIKAGMLAGNYTYDKIGQLTADATEGISEIKWYAGNKKVFKIVRSDANSPLVEFVYDPFGIRILKIEKPRVTGNVTTSDAWKYTYYTHDANGQTMAVYETMLNTIGKDVHLEEQHIYGAGRIGMTVPHKLIYSGETTITDPAETWTHTLGLKNYEVTNYLGNVNAVVTDRKTLVAPQAATITDLVGISVAGGVITKTGSGSWDAGGASAEAVNAGGYVEWTIGGSVLSANQDVMAGLSYTNAGANPNTISYAWYTNPNGFAYIYESGTIVPGGSMGAYTLGTVLGIRRESGMIRYYLNGVLKRSVADPQPQTAMLADFSIRNTGAKIYDLKVSSHPAYDAVVVMKGDYYPFGMQMPAKIDPASGNTIGGNWNSMAYRYGYNGMEKDDEVKGGGNSYTTEFRQYDPRIGRWLSMDPLMAQFPCMSPFVAFDNNPVFFTDPYGLEATGDPIKKSGNRTLDGRKGELKDEIKDLPECGNKAGDIQRFDYDNASVEYKYIEVTNTTAEDGYWEVQVNREDGRSWKADPVTLKEVAIAKYEPPTPELNNEGLSKINEPTNQAGSTNTPSETPSPNTRENPPSRNNAPKPKINSPFVPPVATPPRLPVPPCGNFFVPFINAEDKFTRANGVLAGNALRPYSRYLGENPTATIIIDIYTARGSNYRPADHMWFGKTRCDYMNGAQLSTARFNTITKITRNIDGRVERTQLLINPIYTDRQIGFGIRTSDCR